MSTSDEIFNAVQSLAPTERWHLVSRLWAALPPEAWPGPDEETIAELDRRMAELDSGEVEAIPGEQVRQMLRSWIERDG